MAEFKKGQQQGQEKKQGFQKETGKGQQGQHQGQKWGQTQQGQSGQQKKEGKGKAGEGNDE